MPTRTQKSLLQMWFVNAVILAACVTTAAQITTRPPNPNITAPPPQKHGPQAQPQPLPRGARAPQPVMQAPANGVIVGYVYWDTKFVTHTPANNCIGLVAAVSVGTPPKGAPTFQQFKNIGSYHNFTYLGNVGSFAVCQYSAPQVPIGQDLQVMIYFKQVFTPQVLASVPPTANDPNGPIKIPGGTCNQVPPAVPSASVLGSNWWTCGNNAYNVNFVLQPTNAGNMMSGNQFTVVSGAPQGAANSGQKQTNPGMLSNSGASRGMLMPVSPGTMQTPSNSQTGTLGQLLPAKPSGGGTVQLNPQLPPKVMTSAPIAQSSPMRSGTSGNFVPPMPAMTSNARRDASPAADAATKAQIKSKVQAQLVAAAQRTTQPGNPLNTTSATASELQALRSEKIFITSLRAQQGTARGALVSNNVTKVVMQNRSATNPILITPAPTKLCPSPQVHAVNGRTSGVVFTQDPAYNDYIITGCRFGNQGGQVYLSGAVTGGRIDMVVSPTKWSDTQIEAVVKPGLTGVLDGWPDLIVLPSGGSPAKFPNVRFYAQRQSVLLPNIPQQYATLANVPVGDATHGFGTKYCPGPDVMHLFPCVAYNAGFPIEGITNGHDHRNDPSQMASNAVDRDGGQLQFSSGEDVYDLSSMAPGFQVEYADAFWYAWTSDVCEGWASDAFPKKPGDSVAYDTQGHYGWYTKTKTKVVVDWGVDHCAWRWLGVFKVDDWYNSGYSLAVHVTGPIGVDPWTGHAVSVATNFGQLPPNRVARVP